MSAEKEAPAIAVVIPCYKARDTILEVIAAIGPEVSCILVVDDACPEDTGAHVKESCTDARVEVIVHEHNTGVGGAVITGYRKALARGVDVVVKIDSDGQMDPALIPVFVRPIVEEQADYTKGNRFYHPEGLAEMPALRLLGNGVLSFVTKFSSGYWHLFDPTNGYTAIDTRVIALLPLEKIAERYFFESDILFRLNTVGALVVDIPMAAQYGEEVSHLRIRKNIWPFLAGNVRNFFKRIIYNYFLRNLSVASFQLVLGLLLSGFGAVFGASAWWESASTGVPATGGTVMLAALPILVGVQMLLAFLAADMAAENRVPLVRRLRRRGSKLL